MGSPQEDYSYEELQHYLAVAKTALANFNDAYPNLKVDVFQPEIDVIADLKQFQHNYNQRLLELNAFMEPDEIDGIHVGSYVNKDDEARRKKIYKRMTLERKSFLSDLSDLIRLHETQMRVLYMALSALSAKFTADRMRERTRREEWVKKQEYYFGLYHINMCSVWSAVKDIDLEFATKFSDLPESSGVYFIFNNGDIVYIGHSSNLRTRLKNHKIVQKYHSNNNGFDVECVYAELPINSAKTVERKMIQLVRPKYNERGKI